MVDFDIVLVAPEIPQNTGTIGRLCVCLDAPLHLIRPLGFDISATRVKRAGLDYWQHLQLHVHDDWESFLENAKPSRMMFASTHGKRDYFDYSFAAGDFIVFGNESSGLPAPLYERYTDDLYCIPMPGQHARSHNLANAVSIVAYEAIRQLKI